MRILQLDVDNITYEPVRPEASIYEDVKKERVSIDNTLVIFVSIERGDTEPMASKAVKDTEEFMKKLGRKKLVIYPFAHLSSSLSDPKTAMSLLEYMYKQVPEGVEARKAPFGWNKKLSLDIKGHPLAEQARSYVSSESESKTYQKAKPVSRNTSLVKKSSWAGLPQNDHRTIGEKLDLYSFQEVSPAMVYWHPNGHIIYRELIKFMREKEDEYGYMEVSTPAISNVALWHVSGHMEHYSEDMFVFDAGMGELGLKPMNCPSTILIYKSRKWSYRELPFRTAIFDKIYRRELSGVVTGLFRVKEMTQDDGHIFIREDQIRDEITGLLKMVKEVYATFGMEFKAKLSTMPDNHMGDEKIWETATAALKDALLANGIEYEIKEKEGAFYGPKIDFDVLDSLGRRWQCATIQVDYQQPMRFMLEYTGEDGLAKTPIMIHRAILGSLERFIAVLIEHYQGKLPLWLSPVQASVVSISQQTNGYAEKVYKALIKGRLRASLDISDKTLEYKIREAIFMKIPYIIVVGKKEEESGTVTVRSRNGQSHGIALDDFVAKASAESASRSQPSY